MTAPLLRHPGSHLPSTNHQGNDQFKGGTSSGRTGGPRRSCMGCNTWQPQEGGTKARDSVRWRCAGCVANKAGPALCTSSSPAPQVRVGAVSHEGVGP